MSKYEEVFQKLLKVAKQKQEDRQLNCLFLLEFIQVKISGEVRNMRVIEIFRQLNISIPASCIGYSKSGTIMLFSEKNKPEQPEQKKKKKNAIAEL